MFAERIDSPKPLNEVSTLDLYYQLGLACGKNHSVPLEAFQDLIKQDEEKKNAFFKGYSEGNLNNISRFFEEK